MTTRAQAFTRSALPRVKAAARWLAGAARDALPALAAGLVAALAATLVMLLLRLTLGSVTLPELVGERILPQLDAGTFVRLLIRDCNGWGEIES